MKQLDLFPIKKRERDKFKEHIPINYLPSRNYLRFKNKEEYYKSENWRKKKIFALYRAKYRCEKCGATKSLDLHHKSYDHLYNEPPEDLEILCRKCHKKADYARSERERYEAARRTYYEKKYGEDYDYLGEGDEEFDYWLESKNQW